MTFCACDSWAIYSCNHVTRDLDLIAPTDCMFNSFSLNTHVIKTHISLICLSNGFSIVCVARVSNNLEINKETPKNLFQLGIAGKYPEAGD